MEQLIKQVFANGRINGERKSTQPYDLKLKTKIIKEYLQGDVSFGMLSKRYKINPGVISRWVRVIKNGRAVLKQKKITKFTGMAKTRTIEQLQQENERLKRERDDEHVRAELYKKMIEIAERDLGIPIKKKYGARRSSSIGNPKMK
jgi:transposase